MEAPLPANGSLGSSGAAAAGEDESVLARVHEALKVIYDAHSPNEARHEAQAFLEQVKAVAQAPSYGFNLAADKSQSPIVRHYGLSLLEHAVKHRWAEYSPSEAECLRGWILQLSEIVTKDDPSYLRSKVSQLWVEIAKRCWVGDWMNMDHQLVRMWELPDSPVHKEFVLQVLEMLSDEIFNSDDAVVAVREGILSKACVEIFTPAAVLLEAFPNREAGPDVREGEAGWINRVTVLLNDCLNGDLQNDLVRTCTVKALAVLHSVMTWAVPGAIHVSGCRPVMCNALAAPNVAVQKAALEPLYALFASHSSFSSEEFVQLVVPMYDTQVVDLFKRLLEWAVVDAHDIDDDKYQFSKKFSEMISCLGNFLDRRFAAIPPNTNIEPFLEFLVIVAQSQSLVVSIPVLVTWVRLLTHPSLGPAAASTRLVVPLLELCSSRLLRYESLPEDTDDPTYLLLIEDTDTLPERHAFLGNYRRYSCQIIENIVRLKVDEALDHILNTAEGALTSLYDGLPPLDPANYSKSSMPVLRVDAHFTVVESALKGFLKWRWALSSNPDKVVQQAAALEAGFESWCGRLLAMQVEDPLIRKRILELLVVFSTMVLDKNNSFMLRVLEHILMTWPAPQPEHKVFNDAIRDLQTESMAELQRLASKMPDQLLDVYDQLEAKVKDMIASGTLDEKRQLAYQSFLFIIIFRTSRIDQATRNQRLRAFVEPVKAQWRDKSFGVALESYDGFAQLTGLDKAQEYLARHQIHQILDWGSAKLDAEGLALQAALDRRQTILPLRPTKSFLTHSTERVEPDSASYQAACVMWQDAFPDILPLLLKFLSYSHKCHNPENWTGLPVEMRPIVGRLLTDRFWQAGISEGSKDDFYARVLDKRATLEGLASSIRGMVRFVRETCYAIIYCMTRLNLQFYGFLELPGPLAMALFEDAQSLSAHQVINLLNLVSYLVNHCPVPLRGQFLPPIIAACFQQMDAKISSEWEKLGRQDGVQAAGDELTEEMKAESILRQLTYAAVIMVADFLDPTRAGIHHTKDSQSVVPGVAPGQRFPSLRRFCLMQAAIAGPLLLFCSHAIRMHDGRCCSVVLRVFRSIVPEFRGGEAAKPAKESAASTSSSAAPTASTDVDFPIPEEVAREIREFISTDVLKAAISSLHDRYFVESQKDIGALIASILIHYCRLTPTPREILLTLPNIREHEVDQAISYIARSSVHSRQQRAIVLDLLKDVKGVSISEEGKLAKSIGTVPEARAGGGGNGSGKRPARSKMAQEFMSAPTGGGPGGAAQAPNGGRGESPGFDGLDRMFNQGS